MPKRLGKRVREREKKMAERKYRQVEMERKIEREKVCVKNGGSAPSFVRPTCDQQTAVMYNA